MAQAVVSSTEANSCPSPQLASSSRMSLVGTNTTTTTHATMTSSLTTSKRFSRSEQIARHFWFYWLHQSPHWDSKSFATMKFKAKQYCDALLPKYRNESNNFFKRLIRKFIKDQQPLIYLVQTCLQHLPLKLVRKSMELAEMIDRFVVPLVDERLRTIRSVIRNRNVFLSLTIEEFDIQSDVVMGKRLNEPKIMHYLFVIVGLCDEPEKRFVVKVVKLLEQEQDDLSDRFFANVVIDSLKLVFPFNFGQMVSKYVVNLIAEPALELTQLVDCLRQQHPNVFSSLTTTPYSHRVMHQIEASLRKRHSTVSRVIDTVRMQWDLCETFRDNFRCVTDNLMPPESFYRSVDFYRDNFEAVQLGVLQWRTNRTAEAREALSDAEFQQHLLEDFAQHSKLLFAIERANYTNPHELSLQVTSLVTELKQMSQDLTMHQSDTSLQEFIDWYSETVQDQLLTGGQTATIEQMAQTGDYQLLDMLIRDQISQSDNQIEPINSQLIKLFLVKSIAIDSRFPVPATIPTTNKVQHWAEPVSSSQLRRCFPRFWYLFRQFCTPFPFEYMESCAVVYCFAEVDNHFKII